MPYGAFEEFARKLNYVYRTPGLAVAVAKDGKTIYEQDFGWRDLEKKLPITPDTLFGIGSITKSFTCVAILQLAEAGRLSVDDPVTRYLPEFRTPDPEMTKRMTIHHFMTHTAGLPPLPTLIHAMAASMAGDPAVVSEPGYEQMTKEITEIETYEQLIEFIAGLDFELLGEPGRQFSYSNDAYALLGAIIERVSEKSYEDYINEHILRPAGMTRSTFSPAEAARDPDSTTLYAIREGEDGREEVFPAPIWWHAPAMPAAGFLKSTVSDMLRYADIFRTGGLAGGERILSAAGVQSMLRPYIQCGPCRYGKYYGYGLMTTPGYHGVTLVEHGGGLKGIAAQLTIVPEKGLTGAALSNLEKVPAFDILNGALNVQLGLAPETKRWEYTVQACSDLERKFAGQYLSGEGEELRINFTDGELEIALKGKRYLLKKVDEELYVFSFKEIDMPVKFLADKDGMVTGMYYGLRVLRKAR